MVKTKETLIRLLLQNYRRFRATLYKHHATADGLARCLYESVATIIIEGNNAVSCFD